MESKSDVSNVEDEPNTSGSMHKIFSELIVSCYKDCRPVSEVILRSCGYGNGLFAKRKINKRGRVLSVPVCFCLFVPLIMEDSPIGLIPSSLSFVSLATGLMKAIDHDLESEVDIWSGWERYWQLFPSAEEITAGATLSYEVLDFFLSDETIVACSQKEWSAIYTAFGERVPPVVRWVLAVCRTRAIATDELLALVPFLDMANHGSGDASNCKLVLEPGSNGSYIGLEAIRDIEKDEEILFSYQDDITAEQSFYQFGFVDINECSRADVTTSEEDKITHALDLHDRDQDEFHKWLLDNSNVSEDEIISKQQLLVMKRFLKVQRVGQVDKATLDAIGVIRVD